MFRLSPHKQTQPGTSAYWMNTLFQCYTITTPVEMEQMMCQCIMTSLTYPCNQITQVQQPHTSMICWGIRGINEATPSQSSMSSSSSEMETNHTNQNVYIGKAPRETTVEEMYALLYNIGVKDIFLTTRESTNTTTGMCQFVSRYKICRIWILFLNIHDVLA